METLSRRAMRLALNNTVVFVRQARVSSASQNVFVVALAALLVVGGCRRGKKAAGRLVAHRRHRPTCRRCVRRRRPRARCRRPPPFRRRRAAAERCAFHLDGEPPNLMPLGDAEASALQVTSGLVYETLIDCSDGTYRPALAESWDVSDDRMRLAVRVRSGVRWHDHRAFGVLDVQATIEPLLRKGNDAAALRAALADVASVELVTERTIRFVLKRPSDLVLRALCDVPILPDHIIRGVRAESAPIARQPIGTGPFRFAGWERGKRIRLERVRRLLGHAAGRRRDRLRRSTATPCARSTARGAARSTCCRACSTCTTRSRSSRRRCTAARRSTGWRRGAIRSWPSTSAHAPLSDARFRRAIAMLWDRKRFAGELHNDLARPIGGPPLGGRRRRRRRSIARARSRCSRRPATATATPTACAISDGKPIRLTMLEPAGNKLFNVEARAFVLEMRKAGVLVDLVSTDAATIMLRLKRGEFDLAPMTWQGAPDDVPAALFGSDGAFNYGGYRSSALDALLDEARAAPGPAARAPVLARIAQAADRRAAGDLPLPLRRPRAGLGPRPGPGRRGRSLRSPAGVAGMTAPLLGRAAGREGAPPPRRRRRRAACRRRRSPGWAWPIRFARPRPKATELNSAGKDFYRDGKWEEARIEYRAAEAADPAFLAPRLNVACSFVRQERFAEATAEVEALLATRLRSVGARGAGGRRSGRAQAASRDGAHPARDDGRGGRVGRRISTTRCSSSGGCARRSGSRPRAPGSSSSTRTRRSSPSCPPPGAFAS